MNVAHRIRLVTAGESLRILAEGLADLTSLERISGLAGLGLDHLSWSDPAGAARLLEDTITVYEQSYHDPRYRPLPLLGSLAAGRCPPRPVRPACGSPTSGGPRGPGPAPRIAVLGDGALADAMTTLARAAAVELTTDPAAADAVIVAGLGLLEVRRLGLRNALEKAPPEATILLHAAPWTVTEVASTLRRTERVVGFGLVGNPLSVRLVEVAAGLNTARQAVERALHICRALDKEPLEVGDGPGLVLLRLLSVAANEAAFALDEGRGTPAEIDAQARAPGGPLGPLERADRVGLDVVLLTLRTLQQDYGDPRYRPAIRLRRLVQAGRIGRAGGGGFH